MGEHTPGPWIPEIDHSGNIGHRVTSDANGYPNDGWIICGDMLGPDAKANASLIAAAPDMLKALQLAHKRLCELNRDDEAGMRIVLANAINKATVESL